MSIDYTRHNEDALCDTEAYIDYWSIAFERLSDGKIVLIEMYDGCPLDRARIATILRHHRIFTFNGNKYDIPMIMLAMQPGTTNAMLKKASDELIVGRVQPWIFMENRGLKVPEFVDHVDLMEVSPGAANRLSLKHTGARLHTHTVQELPIPPDARIGPVQRQAMRSYVRNDLRATKDLRNELRPQILLREQMSNQYGVDLRSKSDAQIAEAVIKSEVERATGQRLWKPELQEHQFFYEPPKFIQFRSERMRALLEEIRSTPFSVHPDGVDAASSDDNAETAKKKRRMVDIPDSLKGRDIILGQSVYRMGIGGLHSCEESVTHVSDDEHVLLDRDVASYYPAIIIGEKLYPKHIGPVFLDVYDGIRARRLAAKKAGDKNTAESLKIVLNGSFGKFGSKYSVLCSPKLMIQTTVTGQLALLMQIEHLEHYGIPVISANTDGIVSKVPRHKRWQFNAAFSDWEWDTGYETEETEYRGLYSSSVNSYLAVKPDGKVKSKGPLTEGGPGLPGAAGIKKNPAGEIAAQAVREFLSKGTPIEQTINACDDVRKFLFVRRVTGGCEKDGVTVGKVVRYYFSTTSRTPLLYAQGCKKAGDKVSRSEGAVPLMTLPDFNECPEDLDRAWYVREAYAILQDVGYGAVDPSLRGRTGMFMGRLPKAKGLHWVNAETGIAVCGKERESIREAWEEHDYMPLGHRLCSKCRKEVEW